MSPKPRFPESLFPSLLGRVLPDDEHPRAHARARGENAARAWIASLYDLPTSCTPAEIQHHEFGIKLPSALRPTKVEFVQTIARVVNMFEEKFRFDAGNGYAQVKTKDIMTNEAYGFFDAINSLAQRHDLWEVLSKHPIPQSPIQVRKTTRREAGECNFCPSTEHDVFEIRSNNEHATLAVRCCKACLQGICTQTKGLL